MTKYVSFSSQKVSGSWLKSVTPLRLKKVARGFLQKIMFMLNQRG